jgi:hypothetical protein
MKGEKSTSLDAIRRTISMRVVYYYCLFLLILPVTAYTQSCPFPEGTFPFTTRPCINSSSYAPWGLDAYNDIYWLKQIAHIIGIKNNNIGTPSCPFDSTAFPYSDFSCTTYAPVSLDSYNNVYWLEQIALNIKGAGAGTVTSVGLQMPSTFTVTGTPVTTSGTFTAAATNSKGYLLNRSGILSWDTTSFGNTAWLLNGNSFAGSGTPPYLGWNTATDFILKLNGSGFQFYVNGSGNGNMGLGVNALNEYYSSLLTGSGNIAIGRAALHQETSGSFNTFVGYSAGSSMTNGSECTAIGEGALSGLENGANYDYGIGFQPMGHTTTMGTASYNGGLGNFSLYNVLNGNDNIGLGDSTLLNTSNGNYDIAIGDQAGLKGTTYTNAVAIGRLTAFRGSNTTNLSDSLTDSVFVTGVLDINSSSTGVSAGINIASPTTNPTIGQASLSGGTATISTSAVKANSFIFLTEYNTAGVVGTGNVIVTTITPGTSFIITSSGTLDNSKVNWWIINQP